MNVEIKGKGKDKKLVVELPVNEYISRSGKSLVVASTNGNKPTECEYKGQNIVLGVNAYIPRKDDKGE